MVICYSSNRKPIQIPVKRWLWSCRTIGFWQQICSLFFLCCDILCLSPWAIMHTEIATVFCRCTFPVTDIGPLASFSSPGCPVGGLWCLPANLKWYFTRSHNKHSAQMVLWANATRNSSHGTQGSIPFPKRIRACSDCIKNKDSLKCRVMSLLNPFIMLLGKSKI